MPPSHLSHWLEHARFEIVPVAGIDERVREHMDCARTLTVTCSPRSGVDRTLDVAAALASAGYDVVPHIGARTVASRAHLHDALARADSAGVRDIFVIGGDGTPVGPYPSALALLDAVAESGREFPHVGIAGYPETHPSIDCETLLAGLVEKQSYATYIVTQMCFDPGDDHPLDRSHPRARSEPAGVRRRPGNGGPAKAPGAREHDRSRRLDRLSPEARNAGPATVAPTGVRPRSVSGRAGARRQRTGVRNPRTSRLHVQYRRRDATVARSHCAGQPQPHAGAGVTAERGRVVGGPRRAGREAGSGATDDPDRRVVREAYVRAGHCRPAVQESGARACSRASRLRPSGPA